MRSRDLRRVKRARLDALVEADDRATAALTEYRRDIARIEEARVHSIDNEATAVGAATVALAAVVVALTGDKDVDPAYKLALIVGASLAFLTLLLAAAARMPSPGRLALRHEPINQRDEVLRESLQQAEADLEHSIRDGASRSIQQLVADVWTARGRLLRQRADKKQSWFDAALVFLFLTVAAPGALLLQALSEGS